MAPGIRAPVTEVFELGSESLSEASDSAPPPPPFAGFGLDPFALSSARLEEQRPLRPPMETAPSIVRLTEREEATRRRKVLVLGGVAALGGLVLVLAVVRWATREDRTHGSSPAPVAAHVALPAASPAVVPPAAAASAASANVPSLPQSVAPPTAAPRAAAVVRPKPPPAPRPPAAATPRPKKRKPAFDPSTL